jgi:hypothetical protein
VGEPGRVQLVEKTSKPLKLGLMISSLVASGGLLGVYAPCAGAFTSTGGNAGYGMGVCIAITVVGLCAALTCKALIWWHHE